VIAYPKSLMSERIIKIAEAVRHALR